MSKSQWLQSLGKASLDVPDISDQHYTDPSPDRTEQINSEIDEFQKSVADEARRMGQFYRTAASNKSQQYLNLANLTQTGAKFAQDFKEYREAAQEYDDFRKEIAATDISNIKVLQEQDKVESARSDLEAQGTAVKEQVKDDPTVPPSELIELSQLNFGFKGNIRDLNQFQKQVRPVMRAALENEALLRLPDGSLLSYNEAIRLHDIESANEISLIIDKLIINEARKLGLSRGELKKYVELPMIKDGELREQTLNDAVVSAAETESTSLSNDALLASITLEGVPNQEKFKAVIDRITVEHGYGTLPWKIARQNVFKTLTELVKADKLSLQDVTALGEFEFNAYGHDEPVKVREHWKEEYAPLLKAARTRTIENAEELSRANKGEEDLWVEEKIEQAKKNGYNTDDIQGLLADFGAKFGHTAYPQKLTKLWNDSVKTDTDRLAKLNWLLKNRQYVPAELVMGMSPALRDKNIKHIGTGMTEVEQNHRDENIGPILQDYINAYYPKRVWTGAEKVHQITLVRGEYDKAYAESLLRNKTINSQGEEIPDLAQAHREGLQAVKVLLDENFGTLNGVIPDKPPTTPNNIFIQNPFQDTPGTQKLTTHVNETTTGLKKNNLDVGSEQSFEFKDGTNESQYDTAALKYLKDWIANPKLPHRPPAYFTDTALGVPGVGSHNYLVRRLEARGILKQNGLKASDLYKGDIDELNTGSLSNGSTYRTLTENEKTLGEALVILQKNENHSIVLDPDGQVVEGVDAQTLTIGEVVTYINDGYTVGMYNLGLNQNEFKDALSYIAARNPTLKEDLKGQVFDQNLQDQLALALLTIRQNSSKDTTTGGNSSWCKSLELAIEDCKQFNNGIVIQIAQGDGTVKEVPLSELPWMQVQNLLPEVAAELIRTTK